MKMMKMRKSVVAAMMLLGLVVAPVAASISLADDPAPAAQGGGDLVDASGKTVDGGAQKKSVDTGFWGVVTGSGVLGIILWAALFLDGAAAPVVTRECRRNSRKTTWFPPLGKMRPLPATASQGKSPVPP